MAPVGFDSTQNPANLPNDSAFAKTKSTKIALEFQIVLGNVYCIPLPGGWVSTSLPNNYLK
jgi:hypothetical protein